MERLLLFLPWPLAFLPLAADVAAAAAVVVVAAAALLTTPGYSRLKSVTRRQKGRKASLPSG